MNVLVVEDVPDVVPDFCSANLRRTGHRTQVAYSGESAVRMAREFKPRTIFIDIGSPDIDGYELARRLRTIEGLETSYFVAVSGRDSDTARFEEAGLNLHLEEAGHDGRVNRDSQRRIDPAG